MRILLLFIAILVSACSTSTVYQPAESSDDSGYTETQLTDNQYRVTFRGRRSTEAEAVKDFALLRAAELTLQKGYDWFEVTGTESATRETERLSSGLDLAPAQRVTQSCGLLGCSTSVQSGYVGARVMTTEVDSIHTSALEFTMGTGEPADPNRVYNAAELADSIRSARLSGN